MGHFLLSCLRTARLCGVCLLIAGLGGCTLSRPPPPRGLPSRDSLRPGETITVDRGQNVYRLAQKYKVSMRDLIVLNDLKAPFALRAGQKIVLPARNNASGTGFFEEAHDFGDENPSFVASSPEASPRADAVVTAPLAPPSFSATTPSTPLHTKALSAVSPSKNMPFQKAIPPTSQNQAMKEPLPTTTLQTQNQQTGVDDLQKRATPSDSQDRKKPAFIWPVEGTVLSTFGAKGQGLGNDGVNIAAPRGSPVVAAASGIVVHADDAMKGYGTMVLIRHEEGWITAYGHLDAMFVDKDSVVAAGDMIGTVGKTGTATTPQLHFETRKNGAPVDPQRVLPPWQG